MTLIYCARGTCVHSAKRHDQIFLQARYSMPPHCALAHGPAGSHASHSCTAQAAAAAPGSAQSATRRQGWPRMRARPPRCCRRCPSRASAWSGARAPSRCAPARPPAPPPTPPPAAACGWPARPRAPRPRRLRAPRRSPRPAQARPAPAASRTATRAARPCAERPQGLPPAAAARAARAGCPPARPRASAAAWSRPEQREWGMIACALFQGLP